MTKLVFAGVFLFNQLGFSAGQGKYSEAEHRVTSLELATQFVSSKTNYSDLLTTLSSVQAMTNEERTYIENLLKKNNITGTTTLPKVSFGKGILKIGSYSFKMDQAQQFSYQGIALRKNKTETTEMYIARVAQILNGQKPVALKSDLIYKLLLTNAFAEEEISTVKEVAKGAAIGLAVTAAALFVVLTAVASAPFLGAVTVASSVVALKGTLAATVAAGAVTGGTIGAIRANEKRKVVCEKNRMLLQSDKFEASYSFGMGGIMLPGMVMSADGKNRQIESLEENQKKELNHLYHEACVNKNADKVNELLRVGNAPAKKESETSAPTTR